jgi:hypothetical protein
LQDLRRLIKNMSEQIKNIRLTFSCPIDWDSMDALNDGRYCSHCHKKVYDFTTAGQQEFLKILAENHNNICGRFRLEQMAPAKHSFLPGWKKLASAAMVFIGINVFNNKVEAQSTKLKITNQNTQAKEADIFVGGIGSMETNPEFPGGYEGFAYFLKKNLHYKKGMVDGRVIVTFNVNKNGNLSDFQIARGLSTLNDNEVIRVLKLSPKWKPGTLNGKPATVGYSIPVSFSKK